MSQSESSNGSTDTVHPLKYIEVMSLAADNDEEEDDEEEEATIAMKNPEAVVVLQEEIEMMVQHLSSAIDYSKEVVRLLLQFHGTMTK
jgi:hypothetical protein